MALTTKPGRQSATCMLVPSMLSGLYPATVGTVQGDRQAAAWAYSEIEATDGAPVTVTVGSLINKGLINNTLAGARLIG